MSKKIAAKKLDLSEIHLQVQNVHVQIQKKTRVEVIETIRMLMKTWSRQNTHIKTFNFKIKGKNSKKLCKIVKNFSIFGNVFILY